MDNQIIFGVTDEQSGYKDEILLTNMSNRHGCITGATGTGKTVSLQKLAESFSKKGVPVFLADITEYVSVYRRYQAVVDRAAHSQSPGAQADGTSLFKFFHGGACQRVAAAQTPDKRDADAHKQGEQQQDDIFCHVGGDGIQRIRHRA